MYSKIVRLQARVIRCGRFVGTQKILQPGNFPNGRSSSRCLWTNRESTTCDDANDTRTPTITKSTADDDQQQLWNVYPPVAHALRRGLPVVALESTIVAHGMPYPQNWQLAQDVESILRSQGVEPATIAIKDGQCCIGLSPNDLEDLAKSGPMVRKCSTRDLPSILTKSKEPGTISRWGATTVAATMRLAHCVGISTFVTGGIGGVHRDSGEFTLDISADLTELARTPVIVVSAGIKSILDIGRTLEVLETNGVPVVSYQCDAFPAFFAASSGIVSPERMDSAKGIVDSFLMSLTLGLPNGMLVAVPNLVDPAGASVEAAIQASVQEAKAAGILGQNVTPFILKRVNAITQGTSLRCNMALVKQNARIGAEIALEMSQRLSKRQPHSVLPGAFLSGSLLLKKKYEEENPMLEAAPKLHSDVIVIGGAVIDVIAKPTCPLIMETSNPAICKESDGGVARNVAETLGRLGSRPLFYSAVGDDNAGRSMIDRLQNECGVLSPGKTVSIVPNANTARYVAVMDYDGDLKVACADVDVLNRIHVLPDDETLAAAKYLVLDANLPKSTIASLARRADLLGTIVVFEPTSVPKARDVDLFLKYISFAFPNTAELEAMVDHPDKMSMDIEQRMAHILARMHPTLATLIVTAGKHGVYVGVRQGLDETEFSYYPVKREVSVVNATGAGDTLVGAFLHALVRDRSLEDAIKYGMKAAEVTLQCNDSAVAPNLSSVLRLP